MALTDGQIERYSRQIIVPRVGGRAQECLLAARIAIVGDSRDLAAPLAYLAGAGVGTIAPIVSDGAPAAHALAANVAGLNPDSKIDASGASPSRATLLFMIAGSEASLAAARDLLEVVQDAPRILARVDGPGRIGVFPHPSPCPRCVPELLAPCAARDANAGIVAMAATAEAFKLAARYDADPQAALVEFSGYASRVRAVAVRPGCSCARRGT
jgi:hypothetical protein